MDSPAADTLASPVVVGAFALQIASYVALLAVFSVHGESTPVVEAVRALPTPLLAVLSLPAVPALALSLGLALALDATFGVSPFDLGTVFLTPGDALVYVAAYAVAVLVGLGVRRVFGRRTADG